MSRPRIVEPQDLMPMIDQALLVLGGDMDSREALAMLAWIALHESDHLTATVQRGGGPARGLCQVEPKTYRDSMAQARETPETLAAVVRCHKALLPSPGGSWSIEALAHRTDPPHGWMGDEDHQLWAMGVARIVLWEATSRPLPETPTWRGLDHQVVENREREEFENACAEYWHKWWCRGCKGAPHDFLRAVRWGYSQGIDPLSYEPIAGRW